MPAIIIALLPVILQGLTQAPEYIAEFKNLVALLRSDTTLTDEQKAAIDAAEAEVFKQIQSA